MLFSKSEDSTKWSQRCIPFPKEMEVSGSIERTLSDITLNIPDIRDPRMDTAVDILSLHAWGESGFTVHLLLSSNASSLPPELVSRLKSLPNRDQAYTIQPVSENGQFTGLILAGNTPLGLLYAARTLNQLLSPETSSHMRHIPEVAIIDWPDLEERGEWGWNLHHDRYSIAEMKMNEIEVHSQLGFNSDGSPAASIDTDFLASSYRIGIRVVPIIKHLEQLAKTGLFKYHPDVAAVYEPGKELPSDYQPALCFSKDKTVELITGWMRQLLAYDDVKDINAWLAETPAPCFCDQCAGQNSFQMQTEALVKAFEAVKSDVPDSHLRILLSQASYNDNESVLKSIGPETRITYYHGQKTYDSSTRPMIDSLLTRFAADGGWLGAYPQLTNSWRTIYPFTGGHFIKARMREFVSKGMKSFSGYATPSNSYYDFNIAAAAEWAWNSTGRTVTEFARAYALRVGMKDPDLFAEWADIIGRVGWKIAGSRIAETMIFAASDQQFVDGFIVDGSLFGRNKPLRFGEGILYEFADQDDLQQSIISAKEALDLARQTEEPRMVTESLAALHTLRYTRAMMDIFDCLYGSGNKSRLQGLLFDIDAIGRDLTSALVDWGSVVHPAEREAVHYRYRDTVDFPANIAEKFRMLVKGMNISDARSEYRFAHVDSWSDADFDTTSELTLWTDVTEHIHGQGEYDVRLEFLSGASGVQPQSVTLVTGPTPSSTLTLFSDRWESRLSRYGRSIEYWISVPAMPKSLAFGVDRFYIVTEISGPAMDLPPDRRTTNGAIYIRKSWRGK
jgi:hypothetical protein